MMTAWLKDVIGYGLHAARPAAGSEGALYYETDTTTLFRDNGTTWDALTAGGGGGSGLYTAYLCYQDQKAQNTDGGTFTSGAWQTRTLNTEVADTGNHGALATNQITLDAGTYRVQATAPAFAVYQNQLRVQNVTDGTTLVTGQINYADATGSNGGIAVLAGRFTLAAAKAIELQHRCNTTRATNGFGVPCNFGTEVYAIVELWKE